VQQCSDQLIQHQTPAHNLRLELNVLFAMCILLQVVFSALTLSVKHQEEHLATQAISIRHEKAQDSSTSSWITNYNQLT